jgi:hypothetical protein
MLSIIMPAMRAAAQVSIFLLIGALAISRAFAFGSEGHLLVGAVAEHHLCVEARTAVEKLLGGESLGQAGRWPDWIRSDPEWRHTRGWHYINVGDEQPIEEVARGTHEDVLWAIRRFEAKLADDRLSAEDRATALRFLAHFTADVHQPLHVGRAGDRGGNTIRVRVGTERRNLHAVWDAQALLTEDREARGLTRAQMTEGLVDLTAGQVDALQADLPLVWARESQALRPLVYKFRVPGEGVPASLDPSYLLAAVDIVNMRLSAAGVRLAGQINAVFCRAPNTR